MPFKLHVDFAQAAGTIHTDFERGFICAEVMHYEELHELGNEHAVKAAGKYRQEGKNYTVADGDIIFFVSGLSCASIVLQHCVLVSCCTLYAARVGSHVSASCRSFMPRYLAVHLMLCTWAAGSGPNLMMLYLWQWHLANNQGVTLG